MLMQWPNGKREEPTLTSVYGPRKSWLTSSGWTRPFHVGCDWKDIGAIYSILPGTVIEVGWLDWAGWNVLIYVGEIDGIRTWVRYCHFARASSLKRGDRVELDTILGIEGATGMVDGRHLHMEIYQRNISRGSGVNPGTTIDPRPFIRDRINAAAGGGATDFPIPLEEDTMIAFRWNKQHVFVIGPQQVAHIGDYGQVAASAIIHNPDGKMREFDDLGLTVALITFGVPWYAVDACMKSIAFTHEGGNGGRYWSRLLETKTDVALSRASLASSIEGFKATAASVDAGAVADEFAKRLAS